MTTLLIIIFFIAIISTISSFSIQRNTSLGILPKVPKALKDSFQGYIDVEIEFADFGSFQAEAYMIVCLIANGQDEPRLPISNYKSICELVCSGPQSIMTNHPVWRTSCLLPNDKVFFENRARAVLEVWDSWGNGSKKKLFLGGNSITVEDLLQSNLNGVPWQFGLYEGTAAGYGVVRINWTPKRMRKSRRHY